MNILLVSFLKPDAPSGVRVHYVRLAEQLRQRGHRVDVVTPATLTGPRRHLVAGLRHLLRRLGPVPRALATTVAYYLHIRWGIDASRHYDAVNAQDLGSGLAARHALGNRVPVVVTGHFNAHPAADELRQKPRGPAAARAIERWYAYLLARTCYFIGVSRFGLEAVRAALPSHCECRVVPNGIDLAAGRAATPDAELRQRAAGRHVLLNIGQLESRKNQLLLVRAAHALRQFRQDFVVGLVGKGEDELMLRRHIAELGLDDVVLLLGYHEHEQVLPLLRAAELYVHVATHETFGLVLVEAMAAGVPALALGVGGVPEVLHATPASLLPPDITPTGLAGVLHSWLNAPALRRQLSREQAAYAAAHFDVRQMVDATLSFYEHARRHFRAPHAAVPELVLTTL
ncbi:glycosyltransferase family 4 protein [Hymenobacter convexus]|uniref:glycosyltransferase family 4 protein n=1 Tax=Hymenobacter sp. CA1UV-4 TaxID=3063782 RepID=UPI002714093A|nr:glycosyltransferase family 4 protein [Hymenobacter sp. CA1UV-4]MDO7852502.1 glycosyltransferase family 4 protein [Hymenobacter sp. CA1UV-4]